MGSEVVFALHVFAGVHRVLVRAVMAESMMNNAYIPYRLAFFSHPTKLVKPSTANNHVGGMDLAELIG